MHDILLHHGIHGQRWGVRRFQNEDGTLTEAGKKRYFREERKNIVNGFKSITNEKKRPKYRDYLNSKTIDEHMKNILDYPEIQQYNKKMRELKKEKTDAEKNVDTLEKKIVKKYSKQVDQDLADYGYSPRSRYRDEFEYAYVEGDPEYLNAQKNVYRIEKQISKERKQMGKLFCKEAGNQKIKYYWEYEKTPNEKKIKDLIPEWIERMGEMELW